MIFIKVTINGPSSYIVSGALIKSRWVRKKCFYEVIFFIKFLTNLKIITTANRFHEYIYIYIIILIMLLYLKFYNI
jgi:hypothetical protein